MHQFFNIDGAVFLAIHDSSSITTYDQSISSHPLKTINNICPSNVIQVITNNVNSCKGLEKIIEQVHPQPFWIGVWCTR
jgi:hypothetical protein